MYYFVSCLFCLNILSITVWKSDDSFLFFSRGTWYNVFYLVPNRCSKMCSLIFKTLLVCFPHLMSSFSWGSYHKIDLYVVSIWISVVNLPMHLSSLYPDMSCNQIIHYWGKTLFCMMLVGFRNRYTSALSFGWEIGKPVLSQMMRNGNVTFVSSLPYVLFHLLPPVRVQNRHFHETRSFCGVEATTHPLICNTRFN